MQTAADYYLDPASLAETEPAEPLDWMDRRGHVVEHRLIFTPIEQAFHSRLVIVQPMVLVYG